MQNVPLHINYKGRLLTGVVDPIELSSEDGIPHSFVLYIQGKYTGILSYGQSGWTIDRPVDNELVETVGDYLQAWYE